MVNKKLSKTLGPILGILVFMSAAGITEAPVFAADNDAAKASVTTADSTASTSTSPKDYSVAINKSATENGITVTVDNAIATKHRLEVTLRIEGSKELQSLGHEDSLFKVSYGDKDYGFDHSSSRDYLDDSTMLLTLEKDNYEGEYPETGNLRVDVVLSTFKVNIGMDIPVDFTNTFNKTFEKNISGTIPQLNYSLNKLEADTMGTTITYKEPKQNEADVDEANNYIDSRVLLKVNNKFYKVDSNGSSMGEDKTVVGYYQAKSPTYDTIKDEKDISIIPIYITMPATGYHQYNIISESSKESVTDDLANNISYQKDFSFTDGTKGTIYAIERNDNSIKIHCKGQSEFESLLLASNINLNYKFVKGQSDNLYYSNDSTSFYKDPKDSLGYIVEFDNVQKNKATILSVDPTINQINLYKLGDEIKL